MDKFQISRSKFIAPKNYFYIALVIVCLSAVHNGYSQSINGIPAGVNNIHYTPGNNNGSLQFNKSFSDKKFYLIKNTDVSTGAKSEFILSVSLNALLPVMDLKGSLNDVSLLNGATSSKAYYEKWGYSFGLTAKLPAGKKGSLKPKISLYYTGFLNSGNDSTGTVTIEPKLNILQVALGAEYSFLNTGSIIPFIEAEATANIFTGSISYTDIGGIYNFTEKYNRNVRYGFAAGAGAEYVFNKTYSIFAGLKFSMANLIGKKFDATGAHDLNDEAFTADGFNIGSKNISFLSLYAGVSFGIGN